MLKPGDAAPQFSVEDSTGNLVSLNGLKGKTVVLWFFPKADTPGWTAEGCGFRDLKAEFDRKNAVILGVSFDSPEANLNFSKKFNFNFPLLCDTDRQMGVAYGAAEDGQTKGGAKRIGVIIGPDGKVKEYFPKVDARAFPQEALQKL